MFEERDWIVRSTPLAEQVYEYLRTAILTGKMEPGERIVETKLARQLQTSRSPVREAIRMLVAEQLLRVSTHSILVFRPTLEDFKQTYELRVAIETMACDLAARKMTDSVAALLEHNLAETERALRSGDKDGLIGLNSEFHTTILKASNNHRFQKIMSDVSALIHYYWHLVVKLSTQQLNILAEHTGVYEALREGNGTLAAQRMSQHIMKDLAVMEAAYARTENKGVNE